MIRKTIQDELNARGWSARKLHEESGVRYASVTGFLNAGKDLSVTNLEKILKTLDMETKKKSGSKLPTYKALVVNFNGSDLINPEIVTEMDVTPDEMAAFLLGVLVSRASDLMAKQYPHQNWTLGDTYERFIAHETIATGVVINIPGSVQKRDFVNIALQHFTEKERQAVALLALHKYAENCDRRLLEVNLQAGLFAANSATNLRIQ